jgi:hypothetical protein
MTSPGQKKLTEQKKMRKKTMRYILTVVLLAALAAQISCKGDDSQKTSAAQEQVAQADKAEAIQPAEKIAEPAIEAQSPIISSETVQKTETEPAKADKKEPAKDIAQAVTPQETKKEPVKAETKQTPAKALDEKGVVSYIEGNVKKKTVDEADFKTSVAEKTAVKSRESYKTMIKSRAELELSGLDILRLAPKTTVDLVALYEETKDGKQKTDIKLEEGDLWAQVNSSDEKSEFTMDTDIAAAAITGTNFRMSKDGELTEMKVYHGEVKISNAKDKMDSMEGVSVKDFKAPGQTTGPKQISGPKQVTMEEWVYIVKNMQQITFDRTGKVVSAGEFKATDKSEQSDWVEWNKKRDRQKGLK